MTIKEVSSKYQISQDTLRYYEKEGLIGPINKTSGGIRNYLDSDLQRIEFIKCMRSADVSIEVLKEYITLFDKGEDTFEERKKLLESQREILKKKIAEMQKAYKKLSAKIDLYYSGKLDEYLEFERKEKNK